MADGGVQKPDLSGWGRQIVLIYETFLLRDLLGYVFPGAVLLLGVARLLFGETLTLESIRGLDAINWLTVAFGLFAAYAAGVFLRLFGTWLHILVIAPVVGWLGDPWDLKGPSSAHRPSVCERVWRSPHENAVVEGYRRMYVERAGNVASAIEREEVFLHLAGTLGLALLVVGLMSLAGMFPSRVGMDIIRPLSWRVTVLLLLVGIVLITGHYRHARAIRLLHNAAEQGDRPDASSPTNKRVSPSAGAMPRE